MKNSKSKRKRKLIRMPLLSWQSKNDRGTIEEIVPDPIYQRSMNESPIHRLIHQSIQVLSLSRRKSRGFHPQFSPPFLDISPAWRKAFYWPGRIESSSTGKSFDIALSSIKMAVYSLAILTRTVQTSFPPLDPALSIDKSQRPRNGCSSCAFHHSRLLFRGFEAGYHFPVIECFPGKAASLKESHASVDNRFDPIKFDWMSLHQSNVVREIFIDEIGIVGSSFCTTFFCSIQCGHF